MENIQGHEQVVSNENNWLTDGNGQFVKAIFLKPDIYWKEVTDEQRIAYEHPQPEDEQAE